MGDSENRSLFLYASPITLRPTHIELNQAISTLAMMWHRILVGSYLLMPIQNLADQFEEHQVHCSSPISQYPAEHWFPASGADWYHYLVCFPLPRTSFLPIQLVE